MDRIGPDPHWIDRRNFLCPRAPASPRLEPC